MGNLYDLRLTTTLDSHGIGIFSGLSISMLIVLIVLLSSYIHDMLPKRLRPVNVDKKTHRSIARAIAVVGLALLFFMGMRAVSLNHYKADLAELERYKTAVRYDAQKYVATHDGTAVIARRIMASKAKTYTEPDNAIRIVYYDNRTDTVVNTSNNMSPRQLAESSGFDTVYYIVKTKSTK